MMKLLVVTALCMLASTNVYAGPMEDQMAKLPSGPPVGKSYIPRSGNAPGQVQSGDAGYKIGCSAAAAMHIPSCGDLPSGRQFIAPSAPAIPLGDTTTTTPDAAISEQNPTDRTQGITPGSYYYRDKYPDGNQ